MSKKRFKDEYLDALLGKAPLVEKAPDGLRPTFVWKQEVEWSRPFLETERPDAVPGFTFSERRGIWLTESTKEEDDRDGWFPTGHTTMTGLSNSWFQGGFTFTIDPPQEIPDPPVEQGGSYVGHVTAWRTWRIVEPTGHLLSLHTDFLWPPKERGPDHFERSGEDYGVFARSKPEPESETGWMFDTKCVLGEVALWGRVLTCEKGYRAQYAYPQFLYEDDWVPRDLIAKACALYGIGSGERSPE